MASLVDFHRVSRSTRKLQIVDGKILMSRQNRPNRRYLTHKCHKAITQPSGHGLIRGGSAQLAFTSLPWCFCQGLLLVLGQAPNLNSRSAWPRNVGLSPPSDLKTTATHENAWKALLRQRTVCIGFESKSGATTLSGLYVHRTRSRLLVSSG
jgi:hypothetical protein